MAKEIKVRVKLVGDSFSEDIRGKVREAGIAAIVVDGLYWSVVHEYNGISHNPGYEIEVVSPEDALPAEERMPANESSEQRHAVNTVMEETLPLPLPPSMVEMIGGAPKKLTVEW